MVSDMFGARYHESWQPSQKDRGKKVWLKDVKGVVNEGSAIVNAQAANK
jgi:hypothetical protein